MNSEASGVGKVFVEHLVKLYALSIHISGLNTAVDDLSADNLQFEILHDKLWLSIVAIDSDCQQQRERRYKQRVLILDLSSSADGLDAVAVDENELKSVSTSSSRLKLRIGPDFVQARIPIVQSTTRTNGHHESNVPKPLKASQLKSLSHIKCKNCHFELFHNRHQPQKKSNAAVEGQDKGGTGALMRIIELPSEYWHEFLDCWVCHPDQQTIGAAVSQFKDGRLKQAENTVYCGNSFVSMCREDLSDNVAIDDEGSDVKCGQCDSVVGQFSLREQNVKLNKYDVEFCVTSAGGGDVLGLQCNYVECLVYELFENNRAHANFKFIMCDQETKVPLVALWILNWDTRVLLSNVHNRQTHRLARAVKILYIDAETSNGNGREEELNAICDDEMYEKMFISVENAKVLLSALTQSNQLLPLQFRQIDAFAVSYIHTS